LSLIGTIVDVDIFEPSWETMNFKKPLLKKCYRNYNWWDWN